MRVAYLINQYPKVSHTFIRREILELERQGVEVKRFALRGWDSDLVDPHDTSERKRTKYVLQGGAVPLAIAIGRQLFTKPLNLAKALRLACRVGWRADRPLLVHLVYLAEACVIAHWMAKERLTHLHAHFGTNPATIAMLVGVLTDITWSFTVHGPEEFDKPQFIALPEKMRRCSLAVAISSYGRSQLFRLVEPSHWDKIKVVRCGLDTELLNSSSVPIGQSPRLVCVGRLCEQKGQLLLLEAARRLLSTGEIFELVLAGDGELRPETERLVRKYGLEGHVRITGWLSNADVVKEITSARALVLPSFAEGLPVVIMEAMALGRPVVSTYVAGIPELVRSEKDGWLVAAGDVDALTNAIKRCLTETPEQLTVFGRNAKNRVSEMHIVEREVQLLGRLFTEAIAKSGASRDVKERGEASRST